MTKQRNFDGVPFSKPGRAAQTWLAQKALKGMKVATPCLNWITLSSTFGHGVSVLASGRLPYVGMATCNRLDIAGKSSYSQRAFRRLWKKCGVELHQHDLSIVFMTVLYADKLWHPQFSGAITFVSQCLTEEERSWSIWLHAQSLAGRAPSSSCGSEAVSSLMTVPNDDPGILSWFGVVGLRRTWDQKLSSGLLLTFTVTLLFQFRIADTEQCWLSTLTFFWTCDNTSLRASSSSDVPWILSDCRLITFGSFSRHLQTVSRHQHPRPVILTDHH